MPGHYFLHKYFTSQISCSYVMNYKENVYRDIQRKTLFFQIDSYSLPLQFPKGCATENGCTDVVVL